LGKDTTQKALISHSKNETHYFTKRTGFYLMFGRSGNTFGSAGNAGGPAGGGVANNGVNNASNNPRTFDLEGPPDDCVSRLRWSPLSCPIELLGVTSWDKTVRVYQVQQPQPDQVQSSPMAMQRHNLPVLDMSFASDGRAFFGGCCKTAVEWNLTTNQTRQVAAHDLPVSCLEYVNNGVAQEMLITCGWDGKVRFWDLRQQAPAKEENLGAPIHSMDASTSPMATFATGRKITVYNLQSMSKFSEVESHSMVKYSIRTVANLKNHTGLLMGSSEGRVALVPLNAQATPNLSCCFKAHCIENAPAKNHFTMFPTNFVSAHPEAAAAVSGGADGAVRVWNLATKSRTFELAPRLHNNQAVPCSAGALNARGTMIGFALSYDWSMGKEGYDRTQPRAVSILPVNPSWLPK
jgi:mRNA export factor